MNAFLNVFLNLLVFFLLAFGAIEVVYSVIKLLRRSHVSQRALNAKRKTLQDNPLFATIQLDDETLIRILRRQNSIDGVSGIGGGLGLLIGCAYSWYFHNEFAMRFPHFAVALDFGVTVGTTIAGAVIGCTLSDILNGSIWRRPAGQSLPLALRRMRLYRPRWIVALEAVTVVACVVTSALTINGAIPSSGDFPPQLPPQQALWLTVFVPALIIMLILGTEGNLWLTLHYFSWPTEGEPSLALRLVAASRYEKGYAAFPLFTIAFPVSYLLFGTLSYINFSLSLWLAILGAAWFITYTFQWMLNKQHEKKIRTRILGAARPLVSDD